VVSENINVETFSCAKTNDRTTLQVRRLTGICLKVPRKIGYRGQLLRRNEPNRKPLAFSLGNRLAGQQIWVFPLALAGVFCFVAMGFSSKIVQVAKEKGEPSASENKFSADRV
jgi:hypothetical protein